MPRFVCGDLESDEGPNMVLIARRRPGPFTDPYAEDFSDAVRAHWLVRPDLPVLARLG
jgi:hypothetical protein